VIGHVAACLCLASLGLGCSSTPHASDAAATSPSAAADVAAPAIAAAAPVTPAKQPAAGPNAKSVVGSIGGVVEGTRLSRGQQFQLAKSDQLTLDFLHGARVMLHGPALARLGTGAVDGLLMAEGTASIDLPPGATTPDSGFWLVAPAGRVDIVRGARLALRTSRDGELLAVMVSGSASFARGTDLETSRADSLLTPGEWLRVSTAGVQRTKEKGLTLEAALTKLERSRAQSHEPASDTLDAALSALLDQVQAASERERTLLAEHRAVLHTPDASAMALQGELSRHAAALAGLKKRLRTLLDQRSAARLAREPGVQDPLADKASALLGRAP
jgi:hypothetical protein